MNTRARIINEHCRDTLQTQALDRLAETYASCEVRDLADGGLHVKCYAASPPLNVVGLAPVARFHVTNEGGTIRLG